MSRTAAPLADIAFEAEMIEWRGPAPFYFLPVPDRLAGELHDAAREASYGWGCVPVEAEAGGVAFTTSLFPRDGGYLLPVKATVRRQAGLVPGATVTARIRVMSKDI